MHNILKRSPLAALVVWSALLGLFGATADGQDNHAGASLAAATSVRINLPTNPPAVPNGNNAWAN